MKIEKYTTTHPNRTYELKFKGPEMYTGTYTLETIVIKSQKATETLDGTSQVTNLSPEEVIKLFEGDQNEQYN